MGGSGIHMFVGTVSAVSFAACYAVLWRLAGRKREPEDESVDRGSDRARRSS
jgi:hypothetical protein